MAILEVARRSAGLHSLREKVKRTVGANYALRKRHVPASLSDQGMQFRSASVGLSERATDSRHDRAGLVGLFTENRAENWGPHFIGSIIRICRVGVLGLFTESSEAGPVGW